MPVSHNLAGSATASVAVRASIERIGEAGDRFDCFVHVGADEAIAQAALLDQRVRIAKWNVATARFTRPVNVFDQCAISLPRKGTSRSPTCTPQRGRGGAMAV